MRQRRSIFRLQHLAFGFLVAAASFVIPCGCSKSLDNSSAHPLQLQVITSHAADIRREFADAFSRWHQNHFGTPVEILYPDIGGGGTGNIVRHLDAAYAAHPETSGYDILFGGGTTTFRTYLNKNYLAPLPPLSDEEKQKSRWAVDPLSQVPEDIVGSPLHGKAAGQSADVWIAATAAVFGMEINPDRIAELHRLNPSFAKPTRWEDLAGPQWFGHLSLADPSKSGSVKTSYEMILQSYGWEKGWAILVRLFANASLIRESGSYPADDVASAEAVAAIVIDFYGRLQVARCGPRAAEFVVPEGDGGRGGTALDADPIAMLEGAPHPEIAARFIRFVVSPEGQRLWINKAHVPAPADPSLPNAVATFLGPEKAALGRMAILPELYKQDVGNLFDARDPFASQNLLSLNRSESDVRNSFLGDLIKAALIDNHAALVGARRRIAALGDPPELLNELTALPAFLPADVGRNGSENVLNVDMPRSLTTELLSTLGRQYSPSKDKDPALYPFAERLQTAQKDAWRVSFAERFARLQSR